MADWFKTIFMEDSENGGKGDIQERNRTVVNIPRWVSHFRLSQIAGAEFIRRSPCRVRRMRDGGPVIRALIAAAVPWLTRTRD